MQQQKLIQKTFRVLLKNFTPNFDTQQLLADQIQSEVPREIFYEEALFLEKRTLNNGNLTFELEIKSGKKYRLG